MPGQRTAFTVIPGCEICILLVLFSKISKFSEMDDVRENGNASSILKNLQPHPIQEWRNKMRFVCMMEYYLAFKKEGYSDICYNMGEF